MKELEKILKAFANKRRLAIIKYVKYKREASVGDIAEEIELSFKATSKHLNILLAADILEKDQIGLQMFYRLNSNQRSAAKQIISLL
ncbi:MAG: helix-turn-helix transcriptional regulator [Candidatus Liptonbacteria bacterium]|nr:helix-turn-helix transcriptional regulator [Candidatus Liptonbacteria bacterium]